MIIINNSIQLKNFGKYKLVTSLNTFDNKHEPIFVSTIKENNKFKTILINNKNNLVGINSFKIQENTFNKHTGLGEIMRLISIIDMIENNLQKIQIFSLSKATPFHLKYKFKPINYQPEKLNFNKDLPMELTIQDIKANKTFFNTLFAKHKINYRI